MKCISASKEKVAISSIQQLESENPGSLVVIKVESEPEGFDNGVATLNQLYKKIYRELSGCPDSQDMFVDCLTKKGFYPDEEYNRHRFSVASMVFYLVDERFPRITIPEENRQAFGQIAYELMLNSISEFEKGEE